MAIQYAAMAGLAPTSKWPGRKHSTRSCEGMVFARKFHPRNEESRIHVHSRLSISPNWISGKFSKAATDAGMQKRTSHRAYRIRPHGTCGLLKSARVRAVRRCARMRPGGFLRIGHAVPGKIAQRVRQGVRASEHIRRHQETPEGGRRGFRGAGRLGSGCYRKIEERQRIMQEALQKMAGAVPYVLRIGASGRQGNPGAVPDGMAGRFMGLEDGEGAQIPGIRQGADPVGFALIAWHFQVPQMPTLSRRSTGDCRGKSFRQGMDPAGSAGHSKTWRGFCGGSRTWRPDCKARRQGVPACRQGCGKRIKEVPVACSGRGAPAAQWGCHGADGPYRALSGTPDGLMGHHASPLPQAWSAGAVTRLVRLIPCVAMTSSATGGDFGLGGTATCGGGSGACIRVDASGGDGARIMRIGTMKAEERRCGKPFSGKKSS